MPIIDPKDYAMDAAPGYAPIALPQTYNATQPQMASPFEPPSLTDSDVWRASFERENDVMALFDLMTRQKESELGPIDQDYDIYEDIRGTQYEGYADLFTAARNRKHAGLIKQRIDRDLENIKTLERGGVISFIAPAVASVASPTTFIPIGQVGAAGRLGMAMTRAGTTAAKFAAGNMVATAIQEAILREAQEVRPTIETLFNIGAAGLLGGAFGTGLSLYRSGSFARQLGRWGAMDIDANLQAALSQRVAAMSEAGAARPDLPPIEILGDGTRRMAEMQAQAEVFGVALSGPNLKAATAPSMVERELGAMLSEPILATTRNLEGIPTAPRGGSLETRIKMLTAYQGRAYQALLDAFHKYRFGTAAPTRMQRMGTSLEALRGRGAGGKMTFDQFSQEVSRAMRRGDVHEVGEVAEAAKAQRALLYDPLVDKAIRAGIFQQEVIDRLRPTGKSTAAQSISEAAAQAAGRTTAEPVADPMARAMIRNLISDAENMLGRKFAPDGQIDRIIDEIAGDEDLINRLRRAAYGDDTVFAIDPESGRIVRADGEIVGRNWFDLADDLERGDVVEIHPQVIEKLSDELMEVADDLPENMVDLPKYVMTRAEPLPSGNVRVFFDEAWGIDRTSVVITLEQFRSFRAAHVGGQLLFRASTFGDIEGGIPSRALLKGTIWHEYTHARFSSADDSSADVTEAVGRIFRHAETLGILDDTLEGYMRKIGDPSWRLRDQRVLRDAYDRLYRDRPDKSIMVAEEAIAHMMELRAHGVLTDDLDLAPIIDDLRLVFGDIPPINSQMVRQADEAPTLAIMGEPGPVDPLGGLIPPKRRESRIKDNMTAAFNARRRLEQAARSEREARRQVRTDLDLGLTVRVTDDALGKIRNVLDEIGGVWGIRLGAVSAVRPIGNGLAEIDITGNVGSGRQISETATVRVDSLLDSQALLSRDGRQAVVFNLAGLQDGDDALRGQVAKVILESKVLRGKLPAAVRERLSRHIEDLDPLGKRLDRYMTERGFVLSPRFRDMTLRDYYTLRHGDDPDFDNILQVKAAGHLAEDYASGRMFAGDAKRFVEDFGDYLPRRSVRDDVDLAISALAARNDAIAIDDIELDPKLPHPKRRILAFHGTRKGFERFDVSRSQDIGVHLGTVAQANERIRFQSPEMTTGARVVPVVMDVKTPLTFPDMGTWDPVMMARGLKRQGIHVSDAELDELEGFGEGGEMRAAYDLLRGKIEAAGYDSIRYRNMHEAVTYDVAQLGVIPDREPSGWSYIVWKDGQVKSATSGRLMLAVQGERTSYRRDLFRAIRDLGGIRDEGGDLGALEPPRGIINNETGLSPDEMRSRLMQRGLIDDSDMWSEGEARSTVDDLYEAVRRAMFEDTRNVGEEYRAQILREAEGVLDDMGGGTTLSDAEQNLLVRLVANQGMSVEDAIERVIMRREPEGMARLTERQRAELESVILDVNNRLQGGGGTVDPALADVVFGDGGKASYLTRVYNRPLIKRETHRFIDIIQEYFEQSRDRAKVVLAELEKGYDPATAKAAETKNIEELRKFVDMEDAELKDMAEKVTRAILGVQEGQMMFELPNGLQGPLKSRTLRIPDTFEGRSGKFEDFLESDIRVINNFYARTVGPQAEMKSMFGSLSLEEQIQKVAEEYDRLIERVVPDDETDPRQVEAAARLRAKIHRRRETGIKNLEAMRDRLLNRYGLPDDPSAWGPRTAQVMKEWNLMTMLGGMTVSAIPDMFRPMMTQGMANVFEGGLMPFMRGLEGVRAMKVAGQEVKEAGVAWEMVMPRWQSIADVFEDAQRYSKFESGVGWAADKFGYLSLMNAWNERMKMWAGTIIMNRMMKAIERVGKGTATNDDIVKLAKSQIGELDARLIAEQFKKHGSVEAGLYLPNTNAWDIADPNVNLARETFRAALAREVDITIVTPGLDRPNWMATWHGAIIGQFKSFMFASVQRTMMLGLQQRDAGVLFGASMMVAMGMVVELLKAWGNDKPPPATLPQWLVAGVDRSGLTGWLFEANHMTERLTGGVFGLSALTGKEISRYASRNWLDAFLGPTAGRAKDFASAMQGISAGLSDRQDIRESDIAAFRRMIPLQNLFYMSYLFQKAEDSVREGIGVPKTGRRRAFEWQDVPKGLGTVGPQSSVSRETNVAEAPPQTSPAPTRVATATQPSDNAREETPRVTKRRPGTIPTVA